MVYLRAREPKEAAKGAGDPHGHLPVGEAALAGPGRATGWAQGRQVLSRPPELKEQRRTLPASAESIRRLDGLPLNKDGIKLHVFSVGVGSNFSLMI